jgi:hypothetical protein
MVAIFLSIFGPTAARSCFILSMTLRLASGSEILSYFSDVLCVWAYVSQARVNATKDKFRDSVRIEHRFCSVFGDTDGKITSTWGHKGGYEGFNAHLRQVADRFPHIEVRLDQSAAETIAEKLTGGYWTHDYALTATEAKLLGLPVKVGMPLEVMEFMKLYPQPIRQSGVEYLPIDAPRQRRV